MKTPDLNLLQSLIAGLAMAALPAGATIEVTPATLTYTNDFATAPTADTGWYSSASAIAGTEATFTTAALIDTYVSTFNASTLATALGASATDPPSQNALARHNTTRRALQMRPNGTTATAGKAATVLLLKLHNATSGMVPSMTMGYTFANPGASTAEQVAGWKAYWSFTGNGGWTAIPNFSTATPGNLTATLDFGTAGWRSGALLHVLWVDDNSTGAGDANTGTGEASYTMDDFTFTAAAPVCSVDVTPGATITRNPGADPSIPTDDTVTFSATATGGLGATNWQVTAPAALTANSGTFGTEYTFTDTPISAFTGGALTVTIAPTTDPLCTGSATLKANAPIGINQTVSPARIFYSGAALTNWTADESALLPSRLTNQPAQGDRTVDSAEITLPGVPVQFAAELDAITNNPTGSGFEPADSFALQLIIDGGTPISVLGGSDKNSDGRLTGFTGTNAPELPGTQEPVLTRTFPFRYSLPATATSVKIRYIGNSNSVNETLELKNIRLIPQPAEITVVRAAPSALDNKGTVDPADDEFSGTANVNPLEFAASTWVSDEAPPRSGSYSPPAAVFGPYPVSGGAKTLILTDATNPAAVSQPYIVPLPPAATLTATPASMVQRNADGSLSIQTTVTGSNSGPGLIAAVDVTPAGFVSGHLNYGLVTITIPAAEVPTANFNLKLTDESYPAATQMLAIRLPYIIGQTSFGAPTDLSSVSAEAEWVNNATERTLTMTAGKAGADSIVASEVINLAAIGAVSFSAKFNITETSVGSNLETPDRFKAELLIDGGLASELRINLIDRWDTGDGASSTVAPGANGPKNGYINGYQATAGLDLVSNTTYTLAEDEYNANRIRDEFNVKLDNEGKSEIADNQLNNDFNLAYTIPAGASSVQLLIYGANFASSETAKVSDVMFTNASGSVDSDGDGVSDANEIIMGTSISDANDVLRLSQNPANPLELIFPTKLGAFYRVYVSDDAAAATHLQKWNDASLGTITGNGSTASFNITPGAGTLRRFYRLHVMQTDGAWPATVPAP